MRSTRNFLVDVGMLEALTSIMDVMSDVISHMNRNTAAIVEIGNTIYSLGSALQAVFQEARHSGKETTGRGLPISKDLDHSVDMAQGGQREQEGTNSAGHQLGLHTAFKVYFKALQSVTASKPRDGNVFAAKKAWKRLCRAFAVPAGTHRCSLPCVFSGSALAIYESVAAELLDADAKELLGTA